MNGRIRFGESEYLVEPRFLRGRPYGAARAAWPVAATDTPTDAFFLGLAKDEGLCVMTALSLPCAPERDGRLLPDREAAGRAHGWRIDLDLHHRVPMETPLSGASLVTGQPRPGEYDSWDAPPVSLERACAVFSKAVSGIDFGGAGSVMSVATTHRMETKYSHSMEWYTFRGLLQRMRTSAYKSGKDGIFCLPVGHPDYVEMFATSRTKLNVGSATSGWPKKGGGLKSVTSRPLSMFHGDAIEVELEDYVVLQAADLLAHAVLFAIQGELGWLPGHLRGTGIETAYAKLPSSVLNTAASGKRNDAIVLND